MHGIRLGKKHFLWTLKTCEEFGGKKCVNYDKIEIAQDCLNQIFNPNAFFLTGATWYYYAIYIVFTYFAPFTGYEYDFFEVICKFHVQRCKFGRKSKKIGWKSF